jgi:CDGSH-type Zn-finger protein
MSQALVAGRTPFAVDVEAGRKYVWCRCGRSRRQPYCDGSHNGTGLEPLAFVAERSETVWLCACKRTANAPFCDGSHKQLPATEAGA